MDNILLEISGHFKVPLPIIYHDNYDWLVQVYNNRVVILREGVLRPGLQENTTIYFDDVTAITYSYGNGFCSIRFLIPNMQNTSDQLIMTHKLGKKNSMSFSVFDEASVDNVNYSIRDRGERLKEYHKQILEIYNKYRERKCQLASESTAASKESALDKLKKLKELHDLGIISDDEYAEKRQKMLDEI